MPQGVSVLVVVDVTIVGGEIEKPVQCGGHRARRQPLLKIWLQQTLVITSHCGVPLCLFYEGRMY